MFRIVPEAFQFENQGRQGTNEVFAFRPDPKFHPSYRDATVFHHMARTLALNLDHQRLVAIQGHLIGDVKFGGAILGHLRKEGWFKVQQRRDCSGGLGTHQTG